MNILKSAATWMLIGGQQYPPAVESILSGELQLRYAFPAPGSRLHKRLGQTAFHPNYMFQSVAMTEHAIRGAFTLRIIGEQGMEVEEFEERSTARDAIPNLETLDGNAVTPTLLGLQGGYGFLKVTGIVSCKDGIIRPRERGAQMLERHQDQPYTVYPREVARSHRVDIGGEYLTNFGLSSIDIAQRAHILYSQHFGPVQEL